jgi:nucleotide-binding universal stress UspA family protein
MKILFAADGSQYTKKALAFLVTHESLAGPEDEVLVLNVQIPVPRRVSQMLGGVDVAAYHIEEAEKVFKPIKRFLTQHNLKFRCATTTGAAAPEILKAAKRDKSHLIVMGTHGYGLIGRALIGSVAQKVITDSDIPVLLVK